MKSKRLISFFLSFVIMASQFSFAYAEKTETDSTKVFLKCMSEINSAGNDTDKIAKIVEEMSIPGYEKLSGTAKTVNIPDLLSYLITLQPDNTYKDVNVFVNDVKKAMCMGYINDSNYYEENLNSYSNFFRMVNPYANDGTVENGNFIKLDKDRQYLAAAAIRAFPGGKASEIGPAYYYEYDSDVDYGNYNGNFPMLYNDVHNGVLRSVYASKCIPSSMSLRAGNMVVHNNGIMKPETEYTVEDLPKLSDGNERIFFHSDFAKLRITDEGKVKAINLSVNNPVKIGYFDYDKESFEISNYSIMDVIIDDGKPYNINFFEMEEGSFDSLYVTFDKEVRNRVKNIAAPELIKAMYVNSSPSGIKLDDVKLTWISDLGLKIELPKPLELKKGDNVTLKFNTVKDSGVSVKINDSVSKEVVEDKYSPIAKVHTPMHGEKNDIIRITFSEIMSDSLTKTKSPEEFIGKITVLSEPHAATDSSKNIDLTGASVTWGRNDSRTTAEIKLQNSTSIAAGEYYKVDFKDIVKDLSGNAVNTEPTVAPIGGALEEDNDAIYEAMRTAAGGRTPVILIAGSSSENLEIAQNNYNTSPAQGQAAFAAHGFEPHFIPIAIDNYKEASVSQSNIDLADIATIAYFSGGDQGKHARSFLNDDGTDSRLMTSVRQLFANGGVLTGSSAGDHVLSDPMHANSYSHEVLTKNSPVKILPVDYKKIDDNSQMFLSTGFGFAKSYGLTDSHFDARGRLGRLVVAMVCSNQNIGIGIDEDTAMFIKGNEGKVIGRNGVIIANTWEASTNAGSGKPFEGKDIKLNYLSDGDIFNFDLAQVITAKIKIEEAGTALGTEDIFGEYATTDTMKSLASSSDRYVIGTSAEGEQTFSVIFSKDDNTKTWKDDNGYAIQNMKMQIVNGIYPEITAK